MTTDQMRCALAEVYPGPKWRLRVMGMHERQVVAIYKNMSRTDRLKKRKKKHNEPGVKKVEQLNIFDLLAKESPPNVENI